MDFLKEALDPGTPVPINVLLVRLAGAFGLGLLSALIYAIACRRGARRPEASFLATIVLLSLLIALVTLVIGDNVARAFSLVGTLAIVRFRTVVEDTRDTTFVIYAVGCGMCAGSGYYVAPIAAAPLVLLAAWIFAGRAEKKKDAKLPAGRLVLRLASTLNPEGALKAALDRHLPGHRLMGMSTARGGSAWDATYAVVFPEPAQVYPMVSALTAVDGVQGVELTTD